MKGFIDRKPMWLARPLRLEKVRQQVELMEAEIRRFYSRAAGQSKDAVVRQLLGDLASEESRHERMAERLEENLVTPEVREQESEAERRLFLLQVVQPGLAGLMDGSVSTLAPLFAAAFATRESGQTFLVGLAAEALSDNGSLTGRGSPWLRGVACGLMTAVGGLGHTLP